ncbi:hypothetical protein [uncultured Amnibacterium sp.]|uniref:hypothetical protein n=1 Tax=uncultured Amnibacterium sp. TaxID=1631851 RepID=UPI0035CC6B9E
MSEVDDGAKAIVRLTPFEAERLLENAEDTYADEEDDGRVAPRYGISVLATVLRGPGDLDAAVARIVAGTTLNGRRMAVLTTTELTNAGFVLVQDANELEPDHHLIGEGDMQKPPRVGDLESLFKRDIRKFPRKK